ncbi:unnamed protein product [Mytilus coruscus]|uniref:C3H1-type domain-containing protein n=1 Tax=Mytilus coruscus TaxID=42192 RepID=A0A6J8EHC2_MYTCO|nr:unnamed protein product [Mytilus coruscus]
MCQWSMANLAILHKLLGEGLLDKGQVLDYLSYTTRVYQLIPSHDRVTVFFYDREYRRLQSMHRFRWGTDIPHIQMVYLKPRAARYLQQANTQPQGSGASTRGARNYASHTSSGKEICRKFNSRYGCTSCFEHACSFEHACRYIWKCGQKTLAGVEIDSIAMELRLPGDKLSLLKQELTDFGNRKRASKKQLQSLAGKLGWASTVVHGGRVFLRRIIDSITQLQHDWHNILIKGDIMQDIL